MPCEPLIDAPRPEPPAEPPAAPPVSSADSLEARLLAHGAVALDDSQCLTLASGLREPEALALLDELGSLPEVVGAPPADLARLAGAPAAARLKATQALAERLLSQPLKRRPVLGSWSLVSDYLRTALTGAPREQFRVLFLDRRNRLLRDEVMGHGTLDHAPVYPREVARRALELNAAALVLAHNHPAQDPTPSEADVRMTAEVVAAVRVLGIAVHDHLIVAGQAVASLRQKGLM